MAHEIAELVAVEAIGGEHAIAAARDDCLAIGGEAVGPVLIAIGRPALDGDARGLAVLQDDREWRRSRNRRPCGAASDKAPKLAWARTQPSALRQARARPAPHRRRQAQGEFERAVDQLGLVLRPTVLPQAMLRPSAAKPTAQTCAGPCPFSTALRLAGLRVPDVDLLDCSPPPVATSCPSGEKALAITILSCFV